MSASVFSGSLVKLLKGAMNLGDQAYWLTGTNDPSSVATDAPKGSLYSRTGSSGGAVYRKKDNGSSTNWELIGKGSGGINYLVDSDAEASTGAWIAYADAAGTKPVDGTGGSPTVTITRTTSSPLRGNASFLITKDAANRQGEGVSIDFPIDPADCGQVLRISHDLKGSTNYADGDITLWIYDVTNSRPIPVTPAKIMKGGSPFVGEFQTSSDSTSYRLIMHVTTTNANAWTLEFDNVVVGPAPKVQGTPITDWVPYTPTFVGFSSVASTFAWRRVGDTMEVKGLFAPGGSSATQAQIGIPRVVDTSKVAPGAVVGIAGQSASSATYFGANVLAPASNQAYVNLSAQTSTQNILAPRDGGDFGGAQIAVEFAVPILGWSSAVQMSDDADTRVVAAGAFLSASTPVAGDVVYDAKFFDTHSVFDTTTGKFTVPVPGIYRVHGFTAPTTNVGIQAAIYKNGVQVRVAGGSTNTTGGAFSTEVQCNAGDTLSAQFGTLTLAGDASGLSSNIFFERISGPSQIAATETVAAIFNLTASTATASVPNTTGTTVDYDSKELDTHGAVTVGASWKFKAPASGLYEVKASLTYNLGGGVRDLLLYKNGSQVCVLSENYANGTGDQFITGATEVQMLADDYLELKAYQNSGGALGIETASGYGRVAIRRVGL